MAIEQPNAVISKASVSVSHLRVTLSDGREIATPIEWYPALREASDSERKNFTISSYGLHWGALDEDLSLSGMLAGHKSSSRPGSDPALIVVLLGAFKSKKHAALMADAAIDYADQQEIIRKAVNE